MRVRSGGPTGGPRPVETSPDKDLVRPMGRRDTQSRYTEHHGRQIQSHLESSTGAVRQVLAGEERPVLSGFSVRVVRRDRPSHPQWITNRITSIPSYASSLRRSSTANGKRSLRTEGSRSPNCDSPATMNSIRAVRHVVPHRPSSVLAGIPSEPSCAASLHSLDGFSDPRAHRHSLRRHSSPSPTRRDSL